jgi:hypothetical protein
MDVTITIPNDKLDEFRLGFLKICPVPLVNVADPGDPPDMQPEMSELQWLKKVIRLNLFDKYKQGKALLARENEVVDEGVIA